MKPIKIKTILSYVPEFVFLIMAFVWFMDNFMATPSHINYFMIAIAAFIIALLVFRIKALAFILAVVLGLGSIYMLFAVFSEFNEFQKGDPAGLKLLITGLAIFIGLTSMAIIMPVKYFSEKR